METTDLIIGDWVLINDAPHKIQAIDSIDAEIQADDELYYVEEDRYDFEDKIEGIPITEDFFRENDWEYVCRTYLHKYFVKNVGKFHLQIINNKLYIWFDYSPDDWTQDANVKAPIKYIHDIQHILRLYGLNELADNFKV